MIPEPRPVLISLNLTRNPQLLGRVGQYFNNIQNPQTISTVGLTMNERDLMEEGLEVSGFLQNEVNGGDTETLRKKLHKYDNPRFYYQESDVNALLLEPYMFNGEDNYMDGKSNSEVLALGEHRGGMHSYIWEMAKVGRSTSAERILANNGVTLSAISNGKEFADGNCQGPSLESLVKDIARNGYKDPKDYADDISILTFIRQEFYDKEEVIQMSAENIERYIRKIYDELKSQNHFSKHSIRFQDANGGEQTRTRTVEKPLNRKMLLVELLDRMVRLEQIRNRLLMNKNRDEAQDIAEIQQRLEDDLGLKLRYQSINIPSRWLKGAALEVRDLYGGVVIKRPGHRARYDLEPKREIKFKGLCPWYRKYYQPKFINRIPGARTPRPEIQTPRAVIEEQASNGTVELVKLNDKGIIHSVLFGISIEQLIEDKTIRDLVEEDPARVINDVVMLELFRNVLCELALGLTADTYSDNDFMVDDNGLVRRINFDNYRHSDEEYSSDLIRARVMRLLDIVAPWGEEGADDNLRSSFFGFRRLFKDIFNDGRAMADIIDQVIEDCESYKIDIRPNFERDMKRALCA